MGACVCQPISLSIIVRTCPRAIPLAMITMRKLTHGFPFLSYMGMGLRLVALRAVGALLKSWVLALFLRKFDANDLTIERALDNPSHHPEEQ